MRSESHKMTEKQNPLKAESGKWKIVRNFLSLFCGRILRQNSVRLLCCGHQNRSAYANQRQRRQFKSSKLSKGLCAAIASPAATLPARTNPFPRRHTFIQFVCFCGPQASAHDDDDTTKHSAQDTAKRKENITTTTTTF